MDNFSLGSDFRISFGEGRQETPQRTADTFLHIIVNVHIRAVRWRLPGHDLGEPCILKVKHGIRDPEHPSVTNMFLHNILQLELQESWITKRTTCLAYKEFGILAEISTCLSKEDCCLQLNMWASAFKLCVCSSVQGRNDQEIVRS